MGKEYTLEGCDGNAFSVMAYVTRAMRQTGYTEEQQKDYRNRAMSSDYTNLLFLSSLQIDEVNDRSRQEA